MDYKVLHLKVTPEIHKAIKTEAINQGQTMQSYLTDLITAGVVVMRPQGLGVGTVGTVVEIPEPVLDSYVSTGGVSDLLMSDGPGYGLLKRCAHGADPATCKFARPGKPCKK